MSKVYFEVRMNAAGAYSIAQAGLAPSYGCICKFPVKDGHNHTQRRLAHQMAMTPEIFSALDFLYLSLISGTGPNETSQTRAISEAAEVLRKYKSYE